MEQVIILTNSDAATPITYERLSANEIVPGMLVEESAGKVSFHSTAGGTAQKLFALQDQTGAGTIDSPYGAGVTTKYGSVPSGTPINALVAAGAVAIVDGGSLESAGDGTLRAVVADANTDQSERNSIVAYATISVDNSGGASRVRITARVA
jgi:hypothetical protein